MVACVGLCAALGAANRPDPVTPVAVVSPRTPEEHFARGVELLAADDSAAAGHHFHAADPDGTNPRAAAYQAYCLARSGQHDPALLLYKAALKGGFDSPWVHNDLAYSLLYKGKLRENLEQAVEHTGKAIAGQADPQEAYYNRARARYQLDVNRTTNRLNNRRCLDDLGKALPNGPATADQLVTTALMRTAAGLTNGQETIVFAYLDQAVRLGYPRANIANQPVFGAHLKGLQGFAPFAAEPAAPRGADRDALPPAYGLLAPTE